MNSTIVASILVVLSSIGLGVGTGWLSFKLGSESLKGVNSPLENPSQKINNQDSDLTQRRKFKIIQEKTVLVKVYDYIHQQREASKVTSKVKGK